MLPTDTIPSSLAFANFLLNVVFLGALTYLFIYIGRKAIRWLKK